jgi:DNA-directed RNA polymerase specialized sigma24 family protein
MVGPAMPSPTALANRPRSPEARLLERIRDCTDVAAWAEFVNSYQPVLTAFVRRRGVYPADVPDVVQEILARLARALTCNAASNWIQKRVSRARVEAEWCRHRSTDTGGPDAVGERDRSKALRALDLILAEVRKATSPATWACFEGQVLRGRPAPELAAELGISTNAVYVNACRVRARVRERCTPFSSRFDWS